VHDLVDAMIAARTLRERVRGEVYNVGGGMQRTISVMELLRECERRLNLPLHLNYSAVRPGDQALYISDTSRLTQHTGWSARRSINDILTDIEAFWHQELATESTAERSFAPETPESVLHEEMA
jgi:CDP-paratose 2-epimerase